MKRDGLCTFCSEDGAESITCSISRVECERRAMGACMGQGARMRKQDPAPSRAWPQKELDGVG